LTISLLRLPSRWRRPPLDRPEFLRAEAARQERERVARRLHDTLGQNLSYLRLKLDQLTADDSLRQDPAVYQDLERMRDIANEAYEQIRYTMLTLQPDSPPNLTEDLLTQTQQMAVRIGASFHHQFQGEAAPIQSLIHHKILFIFREALSNIQHHAQATHIELVITWASDSLTVHLDDDGTGFDTDIPPAYGPVGLLIMRQRAEEIGGELTIQSQPGQGTRITLHYPFGETLPSDERAN
jgi:two-component system, NarL family, nitrate/nitrite sensor histidine kinase NarX